MTSFNVIENKISSTRKYISILSFHILHEVGIIPPDLLQRLVLMTGFRNAVAHAYEDLDYRIVFDVLHNGKQDIITFLNIVEKYTSVDVSDE